MKSNNEYCVNGSLRYEETILILPKETSHLHSNRRTHPDGYEWVRVGRNAKYYDNGQVHWVLNYDEAGELIEEKRVSYRPDGTAIKY